MSTGIQSSAPSGSIWTPSRRIPKAPSFIRTPAWTMLTPVGAATWPSGDQVWKGHIPASTPKPTISSGKNMRWKLSENTTWLLSDRSGILKVPRPPSTNIARIAIHISTLPATR